MDHEVDSEPVPRKRASRLLSSEGLGFVIGILVVSLLVSLAGGW
jgi:hypothetical protein